jgi:prolyl 4-hydroxylase
VQYSEGGLFLPHYDACDHHCERMDGKDGPRILTVLIYLNDNFEGGETSFPEIGKQVKPEKGKAVVFSNVDKYGRIIKQSLHGGQPVVSGKKWIANKWIRMK